MATQDFKRKLTAILRLTPLLHGPISLIFFRLDPFFELDSYGTVFRNSEDRAKIVDGLRKAGLK